MDLSALGFGDLSLEMDTFIRMIDCDTGTQNVYFSGSGGNGKQKY